MFFSAIYFVEQNVGVKECNIKRVKEKFSVFFRVFSDNREAH